MSEAVVSYDDALERERLGRIARAAESRYYAETEPERYIALGDYQAAAWAVRADVLATHEVVPPDVAAAIERMLVRADTADDRNLVRAWLPT